MGFLDAVFKRNSELESLFDFELIENTSERIHMKKLAIQMCVDLIGRTISQTEFRVKKGKEIVKDELYYRLNVRPNLNMTASTFWQTFINKLIKDNEVLVIKSDDNDLLIADSFTKKEYAIFDNTFENVSVKGFEFKRQFKMSEVFYLENSNERLSVLLDSVYSDYGELFGRILEFQKRKGQIRGLVDIDAVLDKSEKGQEKLQNYINKIYKSYTEKSVAIVPQQRGFKLEESKNQMPSYSVDEVNKVTEGFLHQVAMALGIPISLLRGDMADIEKQTRNFMNFCIDPILKKVKDESNAKFIEKDDYLNGTRMEVKRISYSNMFDVASAVDKLRAAGVANGNELREELGMERGDDPMLDEFYITKNYQTMSEAMEGGENE